MLFMGMDERKSRIQAAESTSIIYKNTLIVSIVGYVGQEKRLLMKWKIRKQYSML